MGYTTRKPRPLQLCQFDHQKRGISTSQLWLQLRIWVLNELCHDQYIDCAELATLSPPTFKFAIQPQLVESHIENPRISLKLGLHFTASKWIAVRLQIRMLEVQKLVKLQNRPTHHVMIRSELENLTAAKAVEIIKLEPRFTSILAKDPRLYVRSR